jgi:succinyl-diaminopimelate desuccinylase
VSATTTIDAVLRQVDALAGEAVAFTSAMIRIPTINPPGDLYEECARFIGHVLEH